MGLRLLDLCISRYRPLQLSNLHRLVVSGPVKWTWRLILAGGSRTDGYNPHYESADQITREPRPTA